MTAIKIKGLVLLVVMRVCQFKDNISPVAYNSILLTAGL